MDFKLIMHKNAQMQTNIIMLPQRNKYNKNQIVLLLIIFIILNF